MMLDKSVQEFLEKYVNKIDNNDWDWIYSSGLAELEDETGNPYIKGYFSSKMHDCDIYPLDYLKFIPSCYLIGSGVRFFDIPQNIINIESYAFVDCSQLEIVSIPKSVKVIKKDVFNGCESLRLIKYSGTIDEWHHIQFVNSIFPLGLNRKIKVQCLNGEIEV